MQQDGHAEIHRRLQPDIGPKKCSTGPRQPQLRAHAGDARCSDCRIECTAAVANGAAVCTCAKHPPPVEHHMSAPFATPEQKEKWGLCQVRRPGCNVTCKPRSIVCKVRQNESTWADEEKWKGTLYKDHGFYLCRKIGCFDPSIHPDELYCDVHRPHFASSLIAPGTTSTASSRSSRSRSPAVRIRGRRIGCRDVLAFLHTASRTDLRDIIHAAAAELHTR